MRDHQAAGLSQGETDGQTILRVTEDRVTGHLCDAGEAEAYPFSWMGYADIWTDERSERRGGIPSCVWTGRFLRFQVGLVRLAMASDVDILLLPGACEAGSCSPLLSHSFPRQMVQQSYNLDY